MRMQKEKVYVKGHGPLKNTVQLSWDHNFPCLIHQCLLSALRNPIIVRLHFPMCWLFPSKWWHWPIMVQICPLGHVACCLKGWPADGAVTPQTVLVYNLLGITYSLPALAIKWGTTWFFILTAAQLTRHSFSSQRPDSKNWRSDEHAGRIKPEADGEISCLLTAFHPVAPPSFIASGSRLYV